MSSGLLLLACIGIYVACFVLAILFNNQCQSQCRRTAEQGTQTHGIPVVHNEEVQLQALSGVMLTV